MASALNQSKDDFHFEDLFISSSPAPSGSWNTSFPDNAALAAAEEAYHGTTEENIGEEQNYSDEDETEKEEAGGAVPPDTPVTPLPKESIKIVSNITPDSFTKLTLVGKGGFGAVHQVLFKETNEVLAMKSLRKKHLIKTRAVDNTMAEKDVLRKVRHPFIVKLHYAFQSDSKLYLIMDFVNGGHLLHHMHKETLFSETQARFYLAEIILALEHLHNQNIIHRDLKPENCLLDSKGHVVLTDFGFAKENVDSLESCSSFCGTLEYMAPEVVKKSKYGKPADWWSVGILLYDMLCGMPPFQHENDKALIKKILAANLMMPNHISNDCKSLIKGLLQRDIKKRLKVGQIKSHAFFKKVDWKRMLNKEIHPPIIPITKKGTRDVSNFDPKLTKTKITADSVPNSPLSTSQQLQFEGFSYTSSLVLPPLVTPLQL